MVDAKQLADMSNDERQKLLLDVYEVYKNHDVEKKLESPQLVDQLITDVSGKSFQRELVFMAKGTLKADQASIATKITQEVNDVLKGVAAQNKKVSYSAKIGVGDQIAPIENANYVNKDGQTTVNHEQGQVILYDLWATWCPPCQAPMAHNQEMLTKNKEVWGDKVRIVGLSIDNDAPTVKKHVDAKGWNAVEHYHVRNGSCKASETYGSGGVPHVFLVDKSGKIVFMGHPMTRKLEQDINDLLNDKVLTGEGTGPAAEEGEAEIGKGGDQAAIAEAVAKFESNAKAFIEREDVKKVQGLMRGFIVLVDYTEVKNGSIVHKPVCHTQLMGKSDAIASMKVLAKEINQGPWENKDMERAM